MSRGRGQARHAKKRRPANVLDVEGYQTFPCLGWSDHTIDTGETFECGYEPTFACGECLVNGGRWDPRTGRQVGMETLRKLGFPPFQGLVSP